ncbi:threonine synthase [Candidatus Geothermarchaeota archaeon ex4572_27]|nr:MAG: threonine synthase [Candidatus Geothermarchaeota archaeon ex4572_27]
MAELRCTECGVRYPYGEPVFRCSRCGSPLDVLWERPSFSEDLVDRNEQGIWRFWRFLPPVSRRVSLGEGWTPLVRARRAGREVYLKLEYLMPGGSFKDRGAAVAVSRAIDIGLKRVVEDSSGNAAISTSLYASAAGVEVEVHGPGDMPKGKASLISSLGAVLVLGGSRSDAHGRAASKRGYIGHLHNPFFIEGISTLIYEVFLTLRRLPSNIVVPIGSGNLLLAVYRAIKHLDESGLLKRTPRLVGVEAAGYEEVYAALHGHASGKPGTEVADGMRVRGKPRLRQVVEAVRELGDVVVVGEDEVLRAWSQLWSSGFLVEPTSAAAVAGLEEAARLGLLEDGDVLLPLTGSGLKLASELDRLLCR